MIELGKEYLTIWGRRQNIPVERNPLRQYELPAVWSIQGNHYYIDTGECCSGSHRLVDDLAMTPEDAVAFWEARIKEILDANRGQDDKIVLVQGGIDKMRERIEMFKGRMLDS